MKILITGFEPFGKSNKNASQEAVNLVSPESYSQHELIKEILPVVHFDASKKLIQLLDEYSPDIVLCIGESGRAVISLEKVAVNYLDFRIPDNHGAQPIGIPVNPEGKTAYFSTLPLMDLKDKMIEVGIPVEISMTAGTFLCNEIFYTLMEWVEKQKRTVQAGFIHIPILPSIAAKQKTPMPSMTTALVTSGLDLILQTMCD